MFKNFITILLILSIIRIWRSVFEVQRLGQPPAFLIHGEMTTPMTSRLIQLKRGRILYNEKYFEGLSFAPLFSPIGLHLLFHWSPELLTCLQAAVVYGSSSCFSCWSFFGEGVINKVYHHIDVEM